MTNAIQEPRTSALNRAEMRRVHLKRADALFADGCNLLNSVEQIDGVDFTDVGQRNAMIADLNEGLYVSASSRVVPGRSGVSFTGFVCCSKLNQHVPEWVHMRGIVGLVERAASSHGEIDEHPLLMVSGARYLDQQAGARQKVHLFLLPFDREKHVIALCAGFHVNGQKLKRAQASVLMPGSDGTDVEWPVTLTPGRSRVWVSQDPAYKRPGWVVLCRSDLQDYFSRKTDTVRIVGYFNLGMLDYNPA